MKKNVNVFIGVVLCALLCGTFVWLTGTDENDTWKPNEIYDQVHTTTSTGSSTTNATFSNPSNGDGLALRMSSGASLRRPAVSSYAGAYGATSNFSSSTYGGASGAGLHMTSNAEVKSFGGGGNGGSAMGGRASVSNGSSTMAGGSMAVASSPVTYSSARRGNMTLVEDPNAAVMDNPMMAAAPMGAYTSSYLSSGGLMTSRYSIGASIDNQFDGVTSYGISGRRNSDNLWESWYTWFHNWWAGQGGASGDVNVTKDDLYTAWLAYCDEWSSTMGGEYPVSYEEWEACFMENSGYGYNGNTYYWAPVGDILPLIILALLYIAMVAFKRLKTSNENN